eukprot:m.228309 g.228309  ORF g.228309 m.228309 type:complete len:60 (-) comp17441_c0_seq1:10-189(-)
MICSFDPMVLALPGLGKRDFDEGMNDYVFLINFSSFSPSESRHNPLSLSAGTCFLNPFR